MPPSDHLVEKLYDAVNAQPTERARLEVARAALAAAQHRANAIAKKAQNNGKKQD